MPKIPKKRNRKSARSPNKINFETLQKAQRIYEETRRELLGPSITSILQNAIKAQQEALKDLDVAQPTSYSARYVYPSLQEMIEEMGRKNNKFFIWTGYIAFLSGAFFALLSALKLNITYSVIVLGIVFLIGVILWFVLHKNPDLLSNVIKNVKK